MTELSRCLFYSPWLFGGFSKDREVIVGRGIRWGIRCPSHNGVWRES